MSSSPAREPRFLSAAQIHERTKRLGMRVSLSTVYRTLDHLTAKGDVTARAQSDGEASYMLCAPAQHHHHAICRHCGRVEDVDCSVTDRFAAIASHATRVRYRRTRYGIFWNMPRLPLISCRPRTCCMRATRRAANRDAERGCEDPRCHHHLDAQLVRARRRRRARDRKNIVPVGASPETFEPAPQDVAAVADAQILVENGAGLETWLDRLLRDAGAKNLRIVIGADGLPVKNDNPHLWMDPVYATAPTSRKIRDALVAADPAHAGAYRTMPQPTIAELDDLIAHIRAQIATVPPSPSHMIVFHNAWQYYNDRFGITTLGFVERNPGAGTESRSRSPRSSILREGASSARRLLRTGVQSEAALCASRKAPA